MVKRSRSAIYTTDYHLVFNTKYRQGILQDKIAKRAKEILETVAAKRRWTIQEMRIISDHVHMLISVSPQERISDVVKHLKGTSSYYLFREFPELRAKLRKGHLWAPSYFVRAAGNVTIGTIKKYIKEQEKKHKD